MATITGIKVGNSNISAKYGALTSNSVTLTVNALNLATVGSISGLSNQIYTGSAIKLNPTVKVTATGVGTNVTLTKDTHYTVSWSSNTDSTSCIAVGRVTVTVTGKGNYTGTITATYDITGATITVKTSGQSSVIPQSYVYNGYDQGVGLTATTVNSQTATIKYGTTSGTYNLTSAPQIKNVSDSKTIYYQVTAPNHTTKTGSYTLSITKATPTMTLANTNANYHGTAKITATASVAGKVYWGTTNGTSGMTNTKDVTANAAAELTTRTAVGSTTVYAYFVPTDTGNYNSLGSSSDDHTSKTMTVSQASDASVSVTVASNAGTYGSAATLVTATNSSSHGTSAAYVGYKLGAATADSQITWVSVGTALSLTATASAGTYYIYKKWTADGNHSNSGTYTEVGTLSRSKATPTLTLSGSDTTYPTTAVIKATASVTGKVYWGTTSGTSGMSNELSVSAGTATNVTSRSTAGSTTVYAYFVPTDTTNYNSLGSASNDHASKTVTVGKATPTMSLTNTDSTYPTSGVIKATASVAGKVYSGTAASSMTIETSVSANTATTIYTRSTAGETTIYAYFVPTDTGNYNSLGQAGTAHTSKKVTVGKATPTFTLTGETKVYHNTAYIKATASVAGTVYWGTTSSSMSNTKAVTANTATDVTSRGDSDGVGTTTIYAYFVPTDTTNYKSVGSSSSYSQSAAAKTTQATDNDITITVSSTLYYTGGTQIIATKTGGHGYDHFTLGYSTTSGGTVTWGTQDATTISATNPGTYYIHYKLGPDANHSTTITDKQLDATVTISNGSLTISVTGYSGTYNGSAHNIVASGPTTKNQANASVTGVTYTYSTSENGTYGSMPTRTNATGTSSNENATVTYWVKAEKSGYNTAKKSFTVYIARANNPLTISPTTATIYNTSGYNTVQITPSNAQGAVSYASNATGKATVSSSGLVTYVAAGTATITATAAGNDNYKSGSKTCTVTTVVDTISSYGDISGSITITQKANFPAGGVSLTTSNIGTYFKYTSTAAQTITWASGNTTAGSITYAWGGTTVSIPSLGTTETSGVTSRTISFTVTATGEGSKTKSATVSAGNQEANTVTSIALTLYTPGDTSHTAKTQVAFGSTLNTRVMGTYKSGSTGEITPTSITSSDTTVATVS